MARRKPEYRYHVTVVIYSGPAELPVYCDSIYVHACNKKEAWAKAEQFAHETKYWDERIQPGLKGHVTRS